MKRIRPIKPIRVTKVRVALAAGLATLSFPAAMTAGTNAAAKADTATTAAPTGVLDGQLESYAMHVEYDLPLPAGTGTVAHVNAEVRRSDAGENAKGLAGAPTEMDAVVSGKFIDPQGTGKPQRNLPQAECFYPGSLVNTHFYFPTDTQKESGSAPATGYATAQCSAGPTTELHAHDQGSDVPGSPSAAAASMATTGAVASDAVARPVKDVLSSQTSSAASGINILGGLVKVGSVVASGESSTNGKASGGATRADVKVSDITAGGQTFSLSSSSDNGKEQVELTVAGQTVPVDSSAAKSVIDAANQVLGAQGCQMTPLTTPATYPQGYLFSRPEPALGVKPDGSLAASERGGLLIVCTLPKSLTDNFGGFSPERVQILLGFAYTGVTATSSVGGFNLADLGGGAGGLGGAGGGLTGLAGANNGRTGTTTGGASGLSATPSLATGSGTPEPTGTPATNSSNASAAPSGATTPASRVVPTTAIVHFKMDPGLRWLLALLGLLGWAGLTHLGASRFLFATAPCVERP